MKDSDYRLYWEDVDERLIYAELDDKSWQLGEELFGYKKADSLYIYRHGKLAARYSIKDARKEAAVGYAFFSKEKNVAKVIQIKKNIKKEIDAFVSSQERVNLKKLNEKALLTLMIKTLDYAEQTLYAHFLTQPQFFEKFEAEGDVSHISKFEELSKARFEYSRKSWSKILNFSHTVFKEYGRRKGLTLAEAESMTRAELAAEKIDKRLLKQRAEKYVITSRYHKQKVFTGKDADRFIKQYENYKHVDSVQGVVGNPGKVTAQAFVIKNEYLDLKKLPKGMKQGMVLIVQNSWPELSQYYKFASAIVTNEGGITSHGVVVAREFGIPCIVATHIGTKIFKTGNTVEVDAIKGIVRKA